MNRHKVKHFFITFPQTEITKLEFSKFLNNKLKDIKYLKIVQESHEDGNKHLHCLLLLSNGISKPNFLKKITEYYPNDFKRIKIEVLRSISHANNYLSKEDTSPLIEGILPLSKKMIRLYTEVYLRLEPLMPHGCVCDFYRMELERCPSCQLEIDPNKELNSFK